MIHDLDSITVNIFIINRLDDFLRIAVTLRDMPNLWPLGWVCSQPRYAKVLTEIVFGRHRFFFFF